jgi:DNA helicase II / ATP-dependent DNA helicase PcrA
MKKHNTTPVATDSTKAIVEKIWSKFQSGVFHCLTDQTGNVQVRAVAGSGKTTTIVAGFQFWVEKFPTQTAIFICFNKLNADQLQAKVPKSVQARTFHSVCFSAVKRQFPKIVLDNMKSFNTANAIMLRAGVHRDDLRAATSEMVKAHSLLRGTMTDINSPEAISKTLNSYEMDFDFQDIWMSKLAQYDFTMKSNTMICTFDEMLTMVVDHHISLPKFDLVAIDESQDLNLIQIHIANLLVKPTGRIIAIGDPNQSMYRFRGADSSAMDKMSEIFNTQHHLPLSICYRCAKSIIELAQKYVPTIQAADNAPVGTVINSPAKNLPSTINSLNAGTMVVCRANAPLVKHALSLIRQNKRVIVRGKDIGASIIKFYKDALKATRAQNITQLMYDLPQYTHKKMDKLIAMQKDAQAEALQDKSDTLMVIMEDCDNFNEIESRCSTLFSDITPENCITFSSIHRAKGLEADVVVWLFPQINYYFLEKTSNADVIQQEQNICYVAITRAIHTLIIQEQPPRSVE